MTGLPESMRQWPEPQPAPAPLRSASKVSAPLNPGVRAALARAHGVLGHLITVAELAAAELEGACTRHPS